MSTVNINTLRQIWFRLDAGVRLYPLLSAQQVDPTIKKMLEDESDACAMMKEELKPIMDDPVIQTRIRMMSLLDEENK